jgi:hypothetical protein
MGAATRKVAAETGRDIIAPSFRAPSRNGGWYVKRLWFKSGPWWLVHVDVHGRPEDDVVADMLDAVASVNVRAGRVGPDEVAAFQVAVRDRMAAL